MTKFAPGDIVTLNDSGETWVVAHVYAHEVGIYQALEIYDGDDMHTKLTNTPEKRVVTSLFREIFASQKDSI